MKVEVEGKVSWGEISIGSRVKIEEELLKIFCGESNKDYISILIFKSTIIRWAQRVLYIIWTDEQMNRGAYEHMNIPTYHWKTNKR